MSRSRPLRETGLRTSGIIKAASMGGRVPAKQAALPDIVFGNRNHELPVILLPALPEDMLPGIDGIAGVAPLQARRVHFDFCRKALTWDWGCGSLTTRR